MIWFPDLQLVMKNRPNSQKFVSYRDRRSHVCYLHQSHWGWSASQCYRDDTGCSRTLQTGRGVVKCFRKWLRMEKKVFKNGFIIGSHEICINLEEAISENSVWDPSNNQIELVNSRILKYFEYLYICQKNRSKNPSHTCTSINVKIRWVRGLR